MWHWTQTMFHDAALSCIEQFFSDWSMELSFMSFDHPAEWGSHRSDSPSDGAKLSWWQQGRKTWQCSCFLPCRESARSRLQECSGSLSQVQEHGWGTHSKERDGSGGQPDDEGCCDGLLPFSLLVGSKHHKHEDEGSEKLHPKTLGIGHLLCGDGASQLAMVVVSSETVEQGSSEDGPKELGKDVEEGTQEAHATRDQHGKGDGWVEVGIRHVTHAVDDDGIDEPKGQGHTHYLRVLAGRSVRLDPGSTSNQDIERGPQELREDSAPEAQVLQVVSSTRHSCLQQTGLLLGGLFGLWFLGQLELFPRLRTRCLRGLGGWGRRGRAGAGTARTGRTSWKSGLEPLPGTGGSGLPGATGLLGTHQTEGQRRALSSAKRPTTFPDDLPKVRSQWECFVLWYLRRGWTQSLPSLCAYCCAWQTLPDGPKPKFMNGCSTGPGLLPWQPKWWRSEVSLITDAHWIIRDSPTFLGALSVGWHVP